MKNEQEEWISLFNGSNAEGWHSYGEVQAGKAWKATDGVLQLEAIQTKDGKVVGGGDLLTEQEFEDFHLKLEWKLAEGGNSGILFYVQEDKSRYANSYQTGPEMQLLDNEGHPDGAKVKRRAGDLYDLLSATRDATKPVGEWNKTDILCQNALISFYMNDVHILSTTLWDDHWKALIKNSKFREMPDFGSFQRGKIALQDHGDPVWFRNIQIKRL